MARRLTKQQLKAIHAKNGGGGISSQSHKTRNKQSTIKQRPKKAQVRIPKRIVIPKGDIRSHLSEEEINEWEKAAGSELIAAETGTFEGKNTIEVKFQNGEEWFEFQTMKEQKTFFDNNFEQDDSVGKFIEVDHPKIEGYVNLISGISLFKDRLMEK